MKAILVIGFIALAGWFGWTLSKQQTDHSAPTEAAPARPITGPDLPGMPQSLEGTWAMAQQRGATGLRDFLTRYGKTISDPRLAWIQLDYAVLVAKQDPAEARKTFSTVKNRIAPGSLVYPRVKQLEKTYE